MANTVLLAQKAEQVQAELNQWALENGALELGEEIIFSLRVGKTGVVQRDPKDLEGEIKALEITKDHKKLGFTFVATARLGDKEMEQVLAPFSNKARRNMQRLLLGGNNPLKITERTDGKFYDTARNVLRDLVVGDKKYRLVKNRGGHWDEYYVQLWEVEGEMKHSYGVQNAERSS